MLVPVSENLILARCPFSFKGVYMLAALGFPNAFTSATLFRRNIKTRATLPTTVTSHSQHRSVQSHQQAGKLFYYHRYINSILQHIENKHFKIHFRQVLQEETTYVRDSCLSAHI